MSHTVGYMYVVFDPLVSSSNKVGDKNQGIVFIEETDFTLDFSCRKVEVH